MEYSNPTSLKSKFSALISRLHEVGFTDEIITKTILEHPFFSCFERNDYKSFSELSLEEIISKVFRKENVILDYASPYVSEYYWAGEMYFLLLDEYRVPLERSFLIEPLSMMIKLFNPYHEISYSHFVSRYFKDEEKEGIFKTLKKWRNLSTRELSVLTGIKTSTLNSYQKNDFLFQAAYQNVTLLSNAFHIREATFKKKSSFCIISYDLFHNEKFLQSFKDELIRYFNIKKDILFVTVRKTDQEIRELVKEEKQILYLPEFALIKRQGKIIYKFLEDSEIYLLTNNALDKTDL